eukprot:3183936-Rhodomonas_salina.2
MGRRAGRAVQHEPRGLCAEPSLGPQDLDAPRRHPRRLPSRVLPPRGKPEPEPEPEPEREREAEERGGEEEHCSLGPRGLAGARLVCDLPRVAARGRRLGLRSDSDGTGREPF